MATVHGVGDNLVICASSHVIFAQISADGLCIEGQLDVTEISSSLPLPRKEKSEENEQESESKRIDDADIQILCSTVSSCGSLLSVATSAKTVLILDLPTLAFRRGFRIPKAPTSMTFDKDTSHVVVGDRAGHVCRYTVAPPSKCGYTDIKGETSSYEGEPLTGAISMVLDVAISNDGRRLLVADRDEKIRVSRYPEAYIIESFCLGHSAYVGSIKPHGNRLFSSGGDGIVHEWDVESGSSLAESKKIDEEPIRRICVCEKDSNLCIAATMGSTMTVFNDKLEVMKRYITFDSLTDITPFKGNIIGVSSKYVVECNLSDGRSRSVPLPNELLQLLSKSKDPISNYFKNVTHQNMLDYYKRKAEKIETTRENQIRKRKARQLRKAAEKMKKIEGETEMIASS